MRRLFVVGLMLLIAAVAIAVVGPTMPEGSFLRTVGEGFRGMGEFVGRGFGGGYTQPLQGG